MRRSDAERQLTSTMFQALREAECALGPSAVRTSFGHAHARWLLEQRRERQAEIENVRRIREARWKAMSVSFDLVEPCSIFEVFTDTGARKPAPRGSAGTGAPWNAEQHERQARQRTAKRAAEREPTDAELEAEIDTFEREEAA